MKLYKKIDCALNAYIGSKKGKNIEWIQKYIVTLSELVNKLPSGAGIDGGNDINLDESKRNRIVIDSGYHCMDECGGYDGWIEYKVIITPTFFDFDLKIVGRFSDRHGKYADIRGYLEDTYSCALLEVVE